jgi:hypothetical protein
MPGHVRATARRHAKTDGLEDGVTRCNRRVVQKNDARPRFETGNVGIVREPLRLIEELAGPHPVGIYLLDPCVSHRSAAVVRSPTSTVIGPSRMVRT